MGIINKFKPFKTPYRWIFVDPDTKRAYSASTKQELFNQIINYRDQNKLAPIQALEHVIENYLCSLPENASNCEPEKLKRGWMSFIKGGVAVLENVFYGEKNMVSQEVADRRSEICLQCPENVFPDRGSFVKWTDEVAEASTGGKQSKHHNELGSCRICNCPLRALTWYKNAGVKDSEKESYPEHCWKLSIKE